MMCPSPYTFVTPDVPAAGGAEPERGQRLELLGAGRARGAILVLQKPSCAHPTA